MDIEEWRPEPRPSLPPTPTRKVRSGIFVGLLLVGAFLVTLAVLNHQEPIPTASLSVSEAPAPQVRPVAPLVSEAPLQVPGPHALPQTAEANKALGAC